MTGRPGVTPVPGGREGLRGGHVLVRVAVGDAPGGVGAWGQILAPLVYLKR